MERDGIIEKSESEWASPLVVVTKKDGGIRLCVGYRKLNQVTKFDAYPMPRVEELSDEISNAQFIITLDLAKGYWQVPVRQDHLNHLRNVFSTTQGRPSNCEDEKVHFRSRRLCVLRIQDWARRRKARGEQNTGNSGYNTTKDQKRP